MADDADIFAATRKPLSSILPGAVAEAAVAPAAPPTQLGFAMQRQQQDNWCWAAVAVSVSDFYIPPSPWTQCRIADAELDQAICCHDGASAACNQWWYLNRALDRTTHLVNWDEGMISLKAITHEIDNGRPVGVRVEWAGGGGHFVVVAGYQLDPGGGHTIAVFDPWPASGDTLAQAWDTFAGQYLGTGRWTHTYYTSA